MRTFRVELLAPAGGAQMAAAAGGRARSAAEQLAGEGIPVLWVRSVYVPEDDRCFLVFEGGSSETVAELTRRAQLAVQRIEEI